MWAVRSLEQNYQQGPFRPPSPYTSECKPIWVCSSCVDKLLISLSVICPHPVVEGTYTTCTQPKSKFQVVSLDRPNLTKYTKREGFMSTPEFAIHTPSNKVLRVVGQHRMSGMASESNLLYKVVHPDLGNEPLLIPAEHCKLLDFGNMVGYRILEVGEKSMDGDQYYFIPSEKWKQSHLYATLSGVTREIPHPTKMIAAYRRLDDPTHDPDNWYKLEPGEKTKVGDLYHRGETQGWQEVSITGMEIKADNFYRRKPKPSTNQPQPQPQPHQEPTDSVQPQQELTPTPTKGTAVPNKPQPELTPSNPEPITEQQPTTVPASTLLPPMPDNPPYKELVYIKPEPITDSTLASITDETMKPQPNSFVSFPEQPATPQQGRPMNTPVQTPTNPDPTTLPHRTQAAISLEEFAKLCQRTESPTTVELMERISSSVRTIHAIFGMITELGELADIEKRWIFYGKKPERDTHRAEEIADDLWYRFGLYCDEHGICPITAMERVIDKLKKRFPNKFNEHDAVNRDLSAEAQALKGE